MKGLSQLMRQAQEMQANHDAGRLIYTKSGMPRYKRYLDEMPGTPVTSVWTDIPPTQPTFRGSDFWINVYLWRYLKADPVHFRAFHVD